MMKCWIILTSLCFCLNVQSKPVLVVGSKSFTESYILAEMIAQVIDDAGEASAERKLSLGGTGIVIESLKTGAIDIYPEYTGTISEVVLKDPKLKTVAELNQALQASGLSAGEPLGFNNTYALAVSSEFSKNSHVDSISDLLKVPNIRAGFSHEFLNRSDGFKAMTNFYRLKLSHSVAMEHSLIYQSLIENKIDLLEVWSTDAKIEKYNLHIFIICCFIVKCSLIDGLNISGTIPKEVGNFTELVSLYPFSLLFDLFYF